MLFREFGDSSLNFELRVLIKDIKQFLDVQSELNFAIDQAFREANITIPFPQRDLHLIDMPNKKESEDDSSAADSNSDKPKTDQSDKDQPEQESGDHQGSEVEDRVKADEKQAAKEEAQNNSDENKA